MKKYKISAYIQWCYSCALAIFLICIIICILAINNGVMNAWLILVVFSVGSILMLGVMFLDFPAGTFMIDESKIVMKIGMKRYEHSWNDFIECGFVHSHAGSGNIYWLYFSKRFLSDRERQSFMKKTRKELTQVAFFKYNHRIFEEVITFMPSAIATELKGKEIEIQEQMSWLEKIHH